MARWRQRLDADGSGVRVGLVWSGNPAHRADRYRSLAVEHVLARLGHLPVRLYGVQADLRASDAATLAARPDLINLGGGLRDFADTAALLSQLDLLISVDTATAHLAGALGCPVWMMLPFFADWRWQTGRDDTPWYPGMRLFRQSCPGDWDGVLERVEQALRERF
jgi:ADP-heptose:LPS heptosyltransferase